MIQGLLVTVEGLSDSGKSLVMRRIIAALEKDFKISGPNCSVDKETILIVEKK